VRVPLQGSSVVKANRLDYPYLVKRIDINPNLNFTAGLRYDATAF